MTDPTTPTGKRAYPLLPDQARRDILAIEAEAKAQERERLRDAVGAVPSTEPEDHEKDGHHYVIHGGMWWPQDVMAVFDADPEDTE